jgi:branched-chain amino acid transport system permease protein
MSGYQVGLVVLLCFNILAAYAVYLPLVAGQLNLGIAGFMAIGAYAAAYLSNTWGVPVELAVPIGGLAALFVALAVAIPILRTHGIYLALATFALGQIITALILNVEAIGGAAGYPVTSNLDAFAVVGTTAAVIAAMVVLSKSRLGLYLTAVKSDALVADLMGLDIRAIKVTAFSLGAMIAGICGGLYAYYFSFVETQYFSVMLSVNTVLFVLLGGVQTVWGPLVGAAFFTLMPELLRFGDQWRYAIFAAFIILLMAVRPQGLLTANPFRSTRSDRERAGARQ